MKKLMETNYAHQADENKEDDQGSVETVSSEEESEEEVAAQNANLTIEEKRKQSMRRESRAIAKSIKRDSKLTPA